MRTTNRCGALPSALEEAETRRRGLAGFAIIPGILLVDQGSAYDAYGQLCWPASRESCAGVQDRVGFLKLLYASLTACVEGTIVDFQSESSKHTPEAIPRSCVSRRPLPHSGLSCSPPPAAIRHK